MTHVTDFSMVQTFTRTQILSELDFSGRGSNDKVMVTSKNTVLVFETQLKKPLQIWYKGQIRLKAEVVTCL